MSFIDIEVGDAVELEPVDSGEYKVQVDDAEVGTSAKTGGDYILLRLSIPDEPLSKGLTHVMMLPTPDDDEKQQNNRKLSIKSACEALGVSHERGINVEEFIGKQGWAHLGVEESEEYGIQNRLRRWTVSSG